MRRTVTLGLLMSERLAADVARYAPHGVRVRWISTEEEARACDGVVLDATEFDGVLPGHVVLVLGDVNGVTEERLRRSGAVVMHRHLRTELDTLLMAFGAFVDHQALIRAS